MNRALLICFFCCLFALIALPSANAQDLGKTTFANSGAAEAQDAFLRGILLLHSFEYEDAREAFQEARRIDPDFAMAYWGEAMSHNHPVWMSQETNEARDVLKELGTTPEERLARASTEREKDYLGAANILYGEGEKETRDDAFAEAMQRLSEKYPDDLNAAAFYALALLGTSHEGRDYATYMRAASVAEEVFARNPKHPGAAHYLIHSYDDPVHAPLGLRAARVYAQIAPSATHALHMPSHIFVALGMWDEVVASNEDSWAASDARVQAKDLSINQRSYHALSWLMYGYLQQGRYHDAHAMLDTMQHDHQADESGSTRHYLAAMRAAYVVATEDWDGDAMDIEIDEAKLGLESAATNLFIQGVAALETGRRADAEAASQALADRLKEADGPRGKEPASIMADQLEALLLLDAGQADAALAMLEQAAAAEDAMSFDFGPPSPVKPAHELYGDVLLDLNRSAEAQNQYALALERTPKRAQALLGLARAATQAGDDATAQHAYADLRAIWHSADEDLTALQEVSTILGEAR